MAARPVYQRTRALQVLVRDNNVDQALRLGCEAYSLIGLRLFKMATGGVPAASEALRMVPEKITALINAQILIAASVMSGRPDVAPAQVIALYRERVSDNEQRLTS